MQPRCVDLHTHSHVSDGTDSPAEIVRQAAKCNLAAVALTDHDTIDGLDEASEAGKKYDIEVVRGCEISVESPYGQVHLLGLWLPEHSPSFEEMLEQFRADRKSRNQRMVENLVTLGCPISYAEVVNYAKGEPVGRPHIAEVMCQNGFTSSQEAAFKGFLVKGTPAFVPKKNADPQKVTTLLADIGATVAIAHPMLLPCPREWLEDFLSDMRSYGLSAIEAWHSSHNPEQVRYCTDLAARLNLGLTGGSDYHGALKPMVKLGTGRGQVRFTQALYERLKDRRRAMGLPV